MKKTMKLLQLAVILAGIQIHHLNAQAEMQAFTWESNSMAFSIPTSFIISKNDSSVFSAGDSVINLTIYPFDASGVDSSNITTLLGQWVTDNKVEMLSDYEFFNDEGNYYGVLCAGMLDTYYTMLILALDPDYVDIGFYIWFSYSEESLDTVIKIIDSFYPI